MNSSSLEKIHVTSHNPNGREFRGKLFKLVENMSNFHIYFVNWPFPILSMIFY